MHWRSVFRPHFLISFTTFFNSVGGFFCIPFRPCNLDLWRTSLRRWIYFGVIMWNVFFLHASSSLRRSNSPRSRSPMSSSISVSRSWLVYQIRFSVSDVEDLLGSGLIKVCDGSMVGVLSWFCMGSWCFFLGVEWTSSSVWSSLDDCWAENWKLLLVDDSLDLAVVWGF